MEATDKQRKKFDKFLKLIEEGKTVGQACKNLKIRIGTYQSWRRKYKEFGQATKHLTLNNDLQLLKEASLTQRDANDKVKVINVLRENPTALIKEICEMAGITLDRFYKLYNDDDFMKVYNKHKEFTVEVVKSLAMNGLVEHIKEMDKDMIKFVLKNDKNFMEKSEINHTISKIETIEIETIKNKDDDNESIDDN